METMKYAEEEFGRRMEDGTRFQHDRSDFQHLGDHRHHPPTGASFHVALAWSTHFFCSKVIFPELGLDAAGLFPLCLSPMALRILVLGSGGREHALAWKLSQSSLVQQIFVCPGNGGTSQVPKTKNVSVGGNSFNELVAFAVEEKVASMQRRGRS